MKIYRVCGKDEIDKILNNKNFDGVGKHFKIDSKKNNFNYQEDKKYIHFFRSISSILYVDTTAGRYICTYNIPDELLEGKNGFGIYLDFVNFKTLQYVPEFAIEEEMLQFENLEKVDKIIKNIDYPDLFFNPYFKGIIENIYDSESSDERGIE